jgi:hypothetical protein
LIRKGCDLRAARNSRTHTSTFFSRKGDPWSPPPTQIDKPVGKYEAGFAKFILYSSELDDSKKVSMLKLFF